MIYYNVAKGCAKAVSPDY